MKRVFLDANVLFSAAYRGRAFHVLWDLAALGEIALLSSACAIEEARRNLLLKAEPQAQERLRTLLDYVSEVPDLRPGEAWPRLPTGHVLPRGDYLLLSAAVAAHAGFFLTSDRNHFGPLYGQKITGVLVQSPGEFLREENRRRG